MKLNRWHSLVAALWAGLSAGFLYSFGTFSSALRNEFDFTQAELNTIGMCQVAAGLVTFSNGILTDRIGAQAALVLGGIINSGAWFVFALIAKGVWRVSSPSVFLSILVMLATYGGAFVTASVFPVLAKNFPGQSAAPIGIAKAWVGVSAGVATTVFVGFFPSADGDPERLNYLWFLVGTCGLLALLPSPLVRVLETSCTVRSTEEPDNLCIPIDIRLELLTCITLILVAATAAAALLQGSAGEEEKVALSAVILIIVASPVLMLCPKRAPLRRLGVRPSVTTPQDYLAADLISPHVFPGDGAAHGSSGGGESPSSAGQPRAVSPWACGPAQMVKMPEAWLFWLAIFSLQSGGIMLTTNLGSITESRSGPHISAATAVAAFSCMQSLGRLFSGRLSDVAVDRRVPRPWCFVALTAVMGVAHGLLCLPGPVALFAGVLLAGWAFGSMYPVMIVSIGELWGSERIASNYMVYDGSPSAIAAIVVAKYLVQAIYQAHAVAGGTKCHGNVCFRLTHVLVALLQILAACAATVIAVRSRPVYEASVFPASEQSSSRPQLCSSNAMTARTASKAGGDEPAAVMAATVAGERQTQ